MDILAENTSLEELFNQYTGGGRDGTGEAPEGRGVESASGSESDAAPPETPNEGASV